MVVREKCGVLGVYAKDATVDVPWSLYNGLLALQHRGQESAGIATLQKEKIVSEKAMGLVNDAFDYEALEALSSNAGVGHVRY